MVASSNMGSKKFIKEISQGRKFPRCPVASDPPSKVTLDSETQATCAGGVDPQPA